MSDTLMRTPALVRNLESGPLVFATVDFKEDARFEAHGDAQGGDYQYVSQGILGMPSFYNALNKGWVEVVEADDDVKAAIERQCEAWKRRKGYAEDKPAHPREVGGVHYDERGNIVGVPQIYGVDSTRQDKLVPKERTLPVVIERRQPATAPR